MKKVYETWVTFVACAAVLLTAMIWLSSYVLQFDSVQRQAKVEADREEKVRLALWRMDSTLALIVAEENIRPVEDYAPTPPGAPSRDLQNQRRMGTPWLPAALRSVNPTNISLHFEFGSDNVLRSPDAPLDRAGGPPGVQTLLRLQNILKLTGAPDLLSILATNADSEPSLPTRLYNGQRLTKQQELSIVEQQARANTVQNAYNNTVPDLTPSPRQSGSVSQLVPTWFGDELLLLRRVGDRSSGRVQGCWLNWILIRRTLLGSIRDLLPGAELQPLHKEDDQPSYHSLTALPLHLVPGELPPVTAPALTAIRLTLVFAWFAVTLVAIAVAMMLHGAMSLSERRAAFVSAVTHELRTPMTTFKLYSEMLADNMVSDPAQRKRYLQTLCAEANRLGHLVENVLAYSRLERGSARSRIEKLTLGQLIERVQERLAERAEQTEMVLVIDTDPDTTQTAIHVDATAVEHILFNLVDNACKYAAPCSTRREIHLEAMPDSGKFAMLRVRDYGQGISADVQRRLFEPFCKSADEAASIGPGVGLGLALCRRLSRSMGGDLIFDRRNRDGAAFLLQLPIAATRREPSLA
ncbi:MAG TPA: HAMP domain-containing sensor histidine kinase [Candidatus Limnocylindria bacterium]|jgi:signal transduction histidine kinase|nr:HAMP domain-containing sensor histidine kinase [Candidatus Limnocylindria bacterium]